MRALLIGCWLCGLAACEGKVGDPRALDAAAEGRDAGRQPVPADAGDTTRPMDAAVSGMPAMMPAKTPDAGAARDTGAPGSEDSGTPPADAGGQAASCAGMFCEDFESGELSNAVWTRKEASTGNSIAVQGTRVAHGKFAAQFHAKGGTARSMMFFEHLPAALQKHYFGRMYYFATGFPSESGGHTAYITSSNGLAGFPDADHHLEVASYLEDPKATWQMTYWQGDGPEYIGSGGEIPKGQWFCLEWEFSDVPDEIGIWVNGDGTKQGASFRNINNHASGMLGAMTTLGVGFRTWHAMGAPDIDIYVDDIVLDSQRVGCLP